MMESATSFKEYSVDELGDFLYEKDIPSNVVSIFSGELFQWKLSGYNTAIIFQRMRLMANAFLS